jgi:hypothetical protein
VIVKTPSGEKIDYKTMIGFNEMTVAQFVNSNQKDPVKFWVNASLSNQYIITNNRLGTADYILLTGGIKILLPTKNCPPDISKIKEIALRSEKELFQIELSKAKKGELEVAIVEPKDIKFIQTSPMNDE